MYRKIRLKRLYDNVASVRDYIWSDIVRKGEGIEFECNGAELKIEPGAVKMAMPGKTLFESKYDSRKYRLVDFKWEPNRKDLFSWIK